MKKLKSEEKVVVQKAKIVEEEGGLITLLGKKVLFLCMNYHYTGKLVGVNTDCVELENMAVVFETGAFTGPLKNAQNIHTKTGYVRIQTIESYWVLP